MTADDPTANVAYAAYVAHISSGGVEYEAVRAALEAAVPLLAPQPVVDREALAKAAHHYFCIRRSEPNHDPRQSDYDKADEILEILALVNGTAK